MSVLLLILRMASLAIFVLLPLPVKALDSLELNLGQVAYSNWHFQDIRINLSAILETPSQLEITLGNLQLPEPFNSLKSLNIQCRRFSLLASGVTCEQGHASLQSDWLDSADFSITFLLTADQQQLTFKALKVAGGRINMELLKKAKKWRLKLHGRQLHAAWLQKFKIFQKLQIQSGQVDLQMQVKGQDERVLSFNMASQLSALTAQTQDAEHACEGLGLNMKLSTSNKQGQWYWQLSSDLNSGALYSTPLYIEAPAQPITLRAKGYWRSGAKLAIAALNYSHPGVLNLQGSADLQTREKIKLQQADIALQIIDLKPFAAVYINPLMQGKLDDVTLTGTMQSQLRIVKQALTDVSLSFQQLSLQDKQKRMQIQNAAGDIFWSNSDAKVKPSRLSWQQLEIFSLPVGPAKLHFMARADGVNLLQATKLPFFDGEININWFSLQTRPDAEPDLRFEGNIEQVSLAKLSTALGWKPMAGQISGYIPGIHYQQGKLGLDGEIAIKAFAGNINISKLEVAGLLGNLPELHADISIEQLDLQQLTQVFEFGGMEGRLSGFVRDLYLENWRPVKFYAWLGTPENDASRHRISQQAVNNLASIGGGGAADLLSRSFLRFFDTFAYDKVGIGCYLHQGVCQLLGVEAAGRGYYIVKGGGLPRIDVIGYNPQIDWKVLVERLQRL